MWWIEVLGFISLGLIFYGCHLVNPPLGFIVLGVLLLAITVLSAKNKK